jgi:hypothetical protein
MPLLDRASKIVAYPAREWIVVARESTKLEPLFLGYALPLAALGPVCGLVRLSFLGFAASRGAYRLPLLTGAIEAIVSLVLALVGVYILAQIVNTLTRAFNGDPDFEQALKLVTYSYTPIWLSGILLLLPQVWLLRIISTAIGLYGLYLLYLGLPPLMRVPRDNAAGLAAVIAIAAIMLGIVFDFGLNVVEVGLGLRR